MAHDSGISRPPVAPIAAPPATADAAVASNMKGGEMGREHERMTPERERWREIERDSEGVREMERD